MKEKLGVFLKTMPSILGKSTRFLLKSLLILFIILFIIGCIIGGYLGIKILPELEKFKEIAYEKLEEINPNTFTYLGDTVIYDINGNVISEINVGNYEYADIDNVSKWVHLGYIAVEDKRFKVHNGIDYKALLRASISLVKNKGEITQGGSTITQQVIKNNLLTQEKTFKRKFIEFFLAPAIEKKYTKQDIMEFYVNTNFYGNNCYGIESAAQYYFGKSAKDLTLGESALFVGMSNNATLYNPKKNYDLTMDKWKFVLSEMLKEKMIDETEYKDTLEQGLDFIYTRETRVKEDYLTSYAIHSAVLSLMEKENFKFKYIFENEADYTSYKEKYSEVYFEIADKIRAGGYSIYTSLNIEMQDTLQDILDKSTVSFTEKSEDGRYTFQSAAVIVNNETGFVEAIVGGRGTDDEFNRGYLAKRQPGSSIKPLVTYAPAFNSGLYYPSLVMTDKDDPSDNYYPKNYGGSFRGNMSIKEAVGRSTNTIAYQIMKSLGANTGLDYLGKMRFDTISYVDNNNTAVSLGGFTYGVKVVDMAKGYSTLVNNGNYIDNTCILSIDYQNIGSIYKEKSELIPVYEADSAYMMVDCLKGVLYDSYGTARRRTLNNAIAMAKTGTTNGSKDAWFCGSTAYYSMAVWCGYDIPRETSLTGGSIPGEIWNKMMNILHEDKEKIDFKRPKSVVDLPIDYLGKPAKYNSGRYGLFSQTLLDKAEAERKAIIERKKIEADNLLIEEIKEQLDNLKYYKIKDTDALSYLESRFKKLKKSISNVIQEETKLFLYSELEKLEKYFSLDMRNITEYENRQAVLNTYISSVTFENELVSTLNVLNAYVVIDITDIDEIETLYSQISNKINQLKSDEKKDFYNSKYLAIKQYKEILLKPFREELELKKEEERKQAEMELVNVLIAFENISSYYDNVETEFEILEKLISKCENMDIDVKEYKERFYKHKEFILLSKPEIELPTEMEKNIESSNTINEENENNNIALELNSSN